MRSRISRPLVIFTVIVALQAAVSYGVTWREIELTVPTLSSMPRQIDAWSSAGDFEVDPVALELLKPDAYLNRNYSNAAGDQLNLFVGYFQSQRTGSAPHSPQMCLPGAGWLGRTHAVTPLPTENGMPVSVNRYVLEKGRDSIVVLYWYQNHRRGWSEESQTKFQILRDFFQDRRSDVALVRVVLPLTEREKEDQTFATAAAFAKRVQPLVADMFVAAAGAASR